MTDLDDFDHLEPPAAGDEAATMLGYLERQRAIVAWKLGGVDAAGMRATVGTSPITLCGLLKHFALLEDHTLAYMFLGQEFAPPWDNVDWDSDPDWEWQSVADDSPQQLWTLWRAAVERSRKTTAEALAVGGLDQLARRAWPDGRTPNLRRLVAYLIEEYSRHLGHADLIRESVDGQVGEDPQA